MHIALISGSHRASSQSARIGAYLAGRLNTLRAGVTTDLVELARNPLPLWDETAVDPTSPLTKTWAPYAERLRAAEGFVVIAPEWNGMVPAGLKNLFLFTTANEIGHKPALIVAVSASRGGTYPVDELRISGYKNARLCYIPEHLIVRDAAGMFVGEVPTGPEDAYLRKRADYALGVLLAYTDALRPMRAVASLNNPDFPFGM